MPSVAKRPRTDPVPAVLSVDPHPTADKEARDFENDDERRLRRDREHELALLKLRQGVLGKVTGSSNESFNNGLFILLLLLLALCGSEVGIYFGAHLDAVTDGLIKAIFAVVGYVFGSRGSSGQP
jgi:hypothetical protein